MMILAAELIDVNVHEAEYGIQFIRELTQQLEYRVKSLKADGAYGTHRFYHQACQSGIHPIVPQCIASL